MKLGLVVGLSYTSLLSLTLWLKATWCYYPPGQARQLCSSSLWNLTVSHNVLRPGLWRHEVDLVVSRWVSVSARAILHCTGELNKVKQKQKWKFPNLGLTFLKLLASFWATFEKFVFSPWKTQNTFHQFCSDEGGPPTKNRKNFLCISGRIGPFYTL